MVSLVLVAVGVAVFVVIYRKFKKHERVVVGLGDTEPAQTTEMMENPM